MKRIALTWDGSPHTAELIDAVGSCILILTINKTGGFATYSVAIPAGLEAVRSAWKTEAPWTNLDDPLNDGGRFVQDRALVIHGVGIVLWHVDHRGQKEATVPGDSLVFVAGVSLLDGVIV